MKIELFFILLLGAFAAWAQEVPSSQPTQQSWFENLPVSPWLTYGVENRWEKNSAKEVVGRTLNPFAVGCGFKNFIVFYEYGSFYESTGNVTLAVNRKFVNHLLGAHYYPQDWVFSEHFVPYVGWGLGFSKESVETTLSGVTTKDESQAYALSVFHLGVQWNFTQFLWMSVESRLLFGEKTEPTPQVSVLGRLGFWIR